MGATVNNMSIWLSRRLADEVSAGTTDGERFYSAQRLAALDGAYNQVVNMILGATNMRKSAYQLLGELTYQEDKQFTGSGVSLNNFEYRVAAGGVIGVDCVINGASRPAVEREWDDNQYKANYYFKGNDGRPVYFVRGNTLYVEVTLGSYPFTGWVDYVRMPRQLHNNTTDGVYTSSLETNGTLDEIILTQAVALAQMTSDDYEKVELGNQSMMAQLQALISHEFGKSNKRQKGDA